VLLTRATFGLCCFVLFVCYILCGSSVLISYQARLGCDHINALYKFTITITNPAGIALPSMRSFLYCVICVLCLLTVLVRLSVPVQVIDWKDSSLK